MKTRKPAPSKTCEEFIHAYYGSGMLYVSDYFNVGKWILAIKASILRRRLTLEDWRYLFTIAPKNPIRKVIKERIEALGGTIDD